MSESRLWQYIDNNIGHIGHFSRVESPNTSSGIPDVDYCIKGFTNHLELKYSGTSWAKLRPTQSAWFRRRVKNGGVPLLLHMNAKLGIPEYAVIKGLFVPNLVKFKTEDWYEFAHVVWQEKINWDELIQILVNPD